MAATLAGKVTVQLDAILTNAVGLAAVQANLSRGLGQPMATGTGANQWDKVYSEVAKSLSGNYDLDLAGVLLDVFGGVITFARVKAIVAFADPSNTGDVLVGAAAANAFFGPFGSATDKVRVRPGGALCLFAPDATAWAVTAATADILRFAPSAGTQLVDFAILGASV
jgi:hypothetical protein